MTNAPNDGLMRARVALMLTMAMWGVNMSAVKLLTGHFDMLWLAFFRMGLATLAMSWFVIPAIGTLRQIHRGDAAGLLACAALMVYGNQILLLGGIRTSSATNASSIIALSPIIALVIASVALRERMRLRAGLGVALGFGGVAAIILNSAAGELSEVGRGDILMLLSTSALYWVPVFGVLFAIVFLDESASTWHLAGLVGVLGGTWLTSSRPKTAQL